MRQGWVIAVLVLLCGLAGVLGWRLGQPATETEIIDRMAQRYLDLAGEGAAASDCLALPGQGEVRIAVVCAGADGRGWRFEVGARGELLREVALHDEGRA